MSEENKETYKQLEFDFGQPATPCDKSCTACLVERLEELLDEAKTLVSASKIPDEGVKVKSVLDYDRDPQPVTKSYDELVADVPAFDPVPETEKWEAEAEPATPPAQEDNATWDIVFDPDTLALTFRCEYTQEPPKTGPGVLKVYFDEPTDSWTFNDTLYDGDIAQSVYESSFLFRQPGPAIAAAVEWANANRA